MTSNAMTIPPMYKIVIGCILLSLPIKRLCTDASANAGITAQ
jgi:hypothetical protein